MALTSTMLPLALPGNQGQQYAASTSDSGGDMSDSQGGSRHRVRTVTLNRRRHCSSFGFSLRGGREHGTGFFVSAVEMTSEAHSQGLMVGDQIVRINGFPVADATHREVLQLIQVQTSVTLKVRSVGMIPVKDYSDILTWKLVETDTSLLPTSLSSNQSDIMCDDHPGVSQSQNDIRLVLHVAPKAKLGCGICKGPEWRPGIFVQFTKENGLARGAGLRPGDQILQCNNTAFSPDTPFNEAVSVLRSLGLLELVVRKGAGLDLFPGESSGYNSSASSVAGDQSPETWLNKRLSIVKEESVIDSESRYNLSDLGKKNCVQRRGEMNGSGPCTSTKSTNTESTRTVIHVGPEDSNNKNDINDGHKNKLAEICMVSQQTETKTTTVLVEVHQSEEEEGSGGSCKVEGNGLLNSSSISSFSGSTSSSSNNSLSSAISQELQRRSQRRASEASETNQNEKFGTGRNLGIARSGLDKEKVQQHEQLMEEFKLAHRKMFSNGSQPSPVPLITSNSLTPVSTMNQSSQERESIRLKEQDHQEEKPLIEQQSQQQQQQQNGINLSTNQHLSQVQKQKQIFQQNEEQNKQFIINKSPSCTKAIHKDPPSVQRNIIIKESENNNINNNFNINNHSTATRPIVRTRQQSVPPPPPPLPLVDHVDAAVSVLATTKLFSSGTSTHKNGLESNVAVPSPPPLPPSPPACPTPDYDTMSVASEHDLKQQHNNKLLVRPVIHKINGFIGGKAKSSIVVNGKSPSADCVEMESLESFKLTNPSTVKPKPPSTYFAQNGRKSNSRSSDSSLNSRASVQNIAVEGAKPTITLREYPTTLDRKNPSRFHFLNQNSGSSTVVPKDQPISSQLHTELTQTLSRANLHSMNDKQEVISTSASNAAGKSVVTICVNTRQNQKIPQCNGAVNTVENKSQAPFYLHRQVDDTTYYQPKVVSTTIINRPDLPLSDVEMKKSNLKCTSDNLNRNTVTFNFGNNERTESRSISNVQPNGILKNGPAGNISHVQIQNIQSTAMNRIPQQKTIKFGGITTIIQNNPEPKM